MRAFVLVLITAAVASGFTAVAMHAHYESRSRGSGEELIAEVLPKVERSVVSVSAITNTGTRTGSGTIVSVDGEVVTAAHVIDRASAVRVTVAGDPTVLVTQVVGVDTRSDLALLRVGASGLVSSTLADAGSVRLGESVVAVGYPVAIGPTPTVTVGAVSALDRTIFTSSGQTLNGLLQTSAAVTSGDSGGALFDAHRELVGITVSKIEGQDIGFAVPSDRLAAALMTLRQGDGQTRPPFFGIVPETLTEDLQARYDIDVPRGILVAAIQPGSPAARAGLARFDVITRLDGVETDTNDDFAVQLSRHAVGDRVKVSYSRDGRLSDTTVEVGISLHGPAE